MAKGLKDLLDRVLYVQVGPERPRRESAPSQISSLDFSFLTFDEMLSDRASADGIFQVMSLRSFKEAIADDWDRHRRTIGLATENTIFQHLSSRDRCCQESDDTYLFLFDVPNDGIAGEKLKHLTTDLMRCLIGDRFSGVRAQLVEVSAEEIVGEDGGLDPEKLEEALAGAAVVTLETNADGEPMLVEIDVTDRRRDDPDWTEAERTARTEGRLTAGGRGEARLVEVELTGRASAKDWKTIDAPPGGDEPQLAPIDRERAARPDWQEIEGAEEAPPPETAASATRTENTASASAAAAAKAAADWQEAPATGRLPGGPNAGWDGRRSGTARLVDDAAAAAAGWETVLTAGVTHDMLPPLGGWSVGAETETVRLVVATSGDRPDGDPWAGCAGTAWSDIGTVSPPPPDPALGPLSPADFVIVGQPAPADDPAWPQSGDRAEAPPLCWPGLSSPVVIDLPLVRSAGEAPAPEARLVVDAPATAGAQTPVDWPASATREIETPALVTGYAGRGDPEIVWFSRTVVESDGVDTPGRLSTVKPAARDDGPNWGVSRERESTGQVVRTDPPTRRRKPAEWRELPPGPQRPAAPSEAPAVAAPARRDAAAADWGWLPTGDAVADEADFDETPEPGPAREPAWGRLRWPPPECARPGAPPLADSLAAIRLPPDLTAGYWPVWNAASGRIDTFVAVPMRGGEGKGRPSRVVRLLAGASADLTVAVDLALLHATLKRIEENIEARKRLMLVLPLHVATLCSDKLDLVRAIMEGFPAAASARYLYLELTDWPAGLDEAAMAPLRNRLPSLCRDVLLRVDAHGPPPRAIADLRASAIGFDLGPLGRQRCPVIRRPAGGLKTYVWGVNDPDGLDRVIADGHWLTNGPELGPPVGVPSDDQPMRLSPIVDPHRLAASAVGRR